MLLMSDWQYIARLKDGAPAAVVQSATIIMLTKNGKRIPWTGSNGFTCVVGGRPEDCPRRPLC